MVIYKKALVVVGLMIGLAVPVHGMQQNADQLKKQRLQEALSQKNPYTWRNPFRRVKHWIFMYGLGSMDASSEEKKRVHTALRQMGVKESGLPPVKRLRNSYQIAFNPVDGIATDNGICLEKPGLSYGDCGRLSTHDTLDLRRN